MSDVTAPGKPALQTKYLGLTLAHPLVMGASPLVDDLDQVKRIEDAGASAIVMHSLFEEQLMFEEVALSHFTEAHADSYSEATSYFPDPVDFELGPDEYLEQLRKIKQAVSVPVIGSLNGITDRGWLEYAKGMEQAGADALELNVYQIVTDPQKTAAEVERETCDMVRHVTSGLSIPVAVKLSPYYTALHHFAQQLVASGASGLVLFNRFYQPQIDPEQLELTPSLELSSSQELLLRNHWTAILSAQLRTSYATSGGVHSVLDVVRATMSGAHVTQLVSEILKNGVQRFAQIRRDLVQWMEEHEYESLDQMRGSMNLARTPNPSAYERTNYVRVLQSWRKLHDGGFVVEPEAETLRPAR